MECNVHVYLYYFVPDGPVANSVPESGVPVMPTGQELRFRGMDGQSPELVSVALQTQGRLTETRPSTLGATAGGYPPTACAHLLGFPSRPT